jgi:hypothetical protein
MAPRVPLVGALLLLLAVALGAAPCDSAAPRLRGSVACLDCAAGHDLSGTYVRTLVVWSHLSLCRVSQADVRRLRVRA